VAFPALAGAAAAMVLPSASGTTTAGATLLAVGALALLAGHTWGLLVLVPSHATLVGRVAPSVATHGGLHGNAVAVAIVLVTALPGMVLGALLLPRIVEAVAPHTPKRAQAVAVAFLALSLACCLIVPAL
jgi:hypothetical protein